MLLRPRVTAAGRLIAAPGVPPFRFQTHKSRPDAFISTTIAEHGMWEPLETEIVRRLLRIFSMFIDLGANIGWYTAIAQQVMTRRSQIFAFEPEPENFALLRANSGRKWLAPATTIVQAAISDRVGTVDIHLSPSNQGDHRIYASESGRLSVSVPVTTLDHYFKGRPLPPLLLKSDTQGSEPRILRGAQHALSANLAKSAIIIEFWPHGMKASGENVEAFVDYLATLPHTPFVIANDKGRLHSTDWNELAARSKDDLAPPTEAFVDLLLVPPGSKAMWAIEDLMT